MELIKTLLESSLSFDDFKSKLSNNIKIKEDTETDRVLLYTDFRLDNSSLTEIERACRSVIIDKSTLKIVCYTYNEIYYNEHAIDILKSITNPTIYECIEGTLLSVYNYKDKWYISTRKQLDISNNYLFNKQSYYNLLQEVVDPEELFTKLNKSKRYYFVLVHHANKNIIDYTTKFNDTNYKFLYHVLTRDEEFNNMYEHEFKEDYMKYPEKLDNSKSYEELLQNQKERSEGIIIMKDNVVCKLHTKYFKSLITLKPNYGNQYVDYLELYKKDKLKEYLDTNHIDDPQLINTLTIVFKTFSQELYELYKTMWNLKTGKQFAGDQYNLLPGCYKTLFYNMRGVYYKCKTEQRIFNSYEIYKQLKEMNVVELVNILKKRQEVLPRSNIVVTNFVKLLA